MTEAGLGEWQGVTVDAEGRVVTLFLNSNNLAGALPSEIQQLSALTVLYLSHNKLTGPIPAELGQLGALTGLYLDGNQLSDSIPAELARLPALASLYLHGNQLSGQEAFRSQMEEHNPECQLLLVPEDFS
jgi:Leucine-rich repeat (LRR) protein